MPKTLKTREWERIERLKRRAEWLRKQLERPPHRSQAYTAGELSALEWAIPLLEDHMMHRTIMHMPEEVRKQFYPEGINGTRQ